MAGVISKSNSDWSSYMGATGEIFQSSLKLISRKDAIKGYFEIERATLNVEIMIYGLSGMGTILPSEVERKIEISLTRREIKESIAGENLLGIASQEMIASAKSDIITAINEIAKTQNVQLTEDEKEKLANFSMYLMKKVGSAVV
jgi:hypothetical protein